MKHRLPLLRAPKQLLESPVFKVALAICLFLMIGASAVVLYYYNHYSTIIDRRLAGEVFQNTARIYATPYHIYTGQDITADAVVARLQRAGFEPVGSKNDAEDSYDVASAHLTIRPAVGDTLRVDFQKGGISHIVKPGIATVDEVALP